MPEDEVNKLMDRLCNAENEYVMRLGERVDAWREEEAALIRLRAVRQEIADALREVPE